MEANFKNIKVIRSSMAHWVNLRVFLQIVWLLTALVCLVASVKADMRDPTTPLNGGGEKGVLSPLVLNAIVSRGDTRRAIISGSAYTEGSTIGDVVVARITANSVVLRHSDGQVNSLSLRPSVLNSTEVD